MSRLTSFFRAVLLLMGLIGALFGPWWLPVIAIVILSLRFRSWEALVIGLVADFVWLPAGLVAHPPLYTLGAIVLVWALEPLRRRLLVSE